MTFKAPAVIGVIFLKQIVICIFNKNTDEYNVKTSENDVRYSNLNVGKMDVLQRGGITLVDLKEKHSICQLHRSVGHNRCKLSRTCERFPICDDEIAENARCVIKIIGIH